MLEGVIDGPMQAALYSDDPNVDGPQFLTQLSQCPSLVPNSASMSEFGRLISNSMYPRSGEFRPDGTYALGSDGTSQLNPV